MIRQLIRADTHGYRWTVHAFYGVTHYNVDAIMKELWRLGCPAHHARRAYENLTSGSLNTGMTYSSFRQKESVMVVGAAGTASEFFNTLVHELLHLSGHIAHAYGLDRSGEDVAYVGGEIAREIFPEVPHLLRDCCRSKSTRHHG